MNSRPLTQEEIKHLLIIGDGAFKAKSYLKAFGAYSSLVRKLLRNNMAPDLQLYCKGRMLYCQYVLKTISWREIVARAEELIPGLERVVNANAQPANFGLFSNLKADMKKIVISLNNELKQTSYLYQTVKVAIDRANHDKLFKYARMMAITSDEATWDADYLNGLYAELVKRPQQSKFKFELQARLAEAIGSVYNSFAADVKDIPNKLYYLNLAKNKFELAMTNWRSAGSKYSLDLIHDYLCVLESVYENTLDMNAKAKTFEAVHYMIHTDDFLAIYSNRNDDYDRSVVEDAKDHKEWYEKISKQLTLKQKDELERNLMPAPTMRATKKRRLGNDIYAPVDGQKTEAMAEISTPESSEKISEGYVWL